MGVLLFFFIAVAILTIVAKKSNKTRNAPGRGSGWRKYSYDTDADVWPFVKRPVMTASEQVLYHRLRLAVPQFIVLSQVDLGQILDVRKGHDFKAWRNRINRMSVDFVICDKASNIICCIELDDRSHEREDRRESDAKKDKALRSAGVQIIRVTVRNMPSHEDIQGMIKPFIPVI